ncbi:MAG: cyclic nucleotide-binding domain-containing protein [Myxococcaceae bacterium]|nr:cyclic nucleotide-binding domain-containing protein [Myxococcaceae bacterium]
MSDSAHDNSGVVRVDLKRADLSELVKSDSWLKDAPLLLALGDAAGQVLHQATGRRYPQGVSLFARDDDSDSLFLVLKGEVRLFLQQGTERVELGVAGRGDVLGEAEVLDGHGPRGYSAAAAVDVDAVEIPRLALLDVGDSQRTLLKFLNGVRTQRRAALEAMADFLQRW